jgi:hypothetical protein
MVGNGNGNVLVEVNAAVRKPPHVAFCFTSLWRCIANGHQGTKFANDFGLTESFGVNDITELLGRKVEEPVKGFSQTKVVCKFCSLVSIRKTTLV